MLLRILDSELVTLFGVVDVLLLIEWRFSRKKTALLAGGVTVLFALLTAVMVYLGAVDHAIRIIYMPSMLAFTFYISRYRDARTFYANCTSALFTVSGSVLGMLAEDLFVPAAGAVVRSVLYLLCLLAVYFLFRRPLLAMARELESGWLRLCLVPVILMGALMALTLGYQGSCAVNTFGLCALALGSFFVYSGFNQLFLRLQRQARLREDNAALRSQVESMRQAAERRMSMDREDRIFRHDLRHYMGILEGCLGSGDGAGAARVLEQMEQKLNCGGPAALRCFTGEPIVDAILSRFEARAGAAGVEFSAKMNLPAGLKADRTELGVFLSNALENAYHACLRIPEGRPRAIRVVDSATMGQYFLSISNNYTGTVRFDPVTGLPLADAEGHGIGSQSIAAFVQKYGAQLDYTARDGWFSIKLLL